MIKELIISMRPKQWYKNIVIFVCIVFSLNFFNAQMWIDILSAFVIFCLISSSEYLINDIIDIEKDKLHPKKRKRPLASGKLKVSHALTAAILMLVVAFVWAYFVNLLFLSMAGIFFAMVLLYSLVLKRIVLVDVLIISTGFVIRAIAGCVAITVKISPWLIICAFLMALFLALLKRRNELVILGDDAKKHRENLGGYSLELLEKFILIVTTTLIMSYSLYTFLTGNVYLMITIPIVLYALFRYLFLVYKKNLGGDPVEVFTDKGIMISMVLWGAVALIVMYEIPQKVLDAIG